MLIIRLTPNGSVDPTPEWEPPDPKHTPLAELVADLAPPSR